MRHAMRQVMMGIAAETSLESHLSALEGCNGDGIGLFHSGEALDFVLGHLPDAVLVCDTGGRVLFVNRACERLLERPAAELVGANRSEFERVSQQTREGWEVRWACPSSGRGFEATYMTASGRICVEVRERRVKFHGKAVSLVVLRDIELRKERERRAGDSLAMMSHDVRNGLSLIAGNLEMLGRADLSPDQRAIVGRLHMKTKAVAMLVTNCLDFERIDAGKLTLANKPVDLNEVLYQVGAQYGVEALRRKIRLAIDLGKGLPRVSGDRLALDRIFGNLVQNALKFTSEDGEVTIRSSMARGSVVAVIEDTGSGMTEEELETVFDRYCRGARGREIDGTGLGLAIARALTEAQEGTLAAESAVGTGSRFTVRLPALPATVDGPRMAMLKSR